jgi:triacylglycerol esterase/lipase EstA (alpha/beta hydrolase family)
MAGRRGWIRWAAPAAASTLVGAALVGLAGPAGMAPVGATSTNGVVAAAPAYPVGDAGTGYAAEVVDPTSVPPGVNVWSCRPSSSHPYPVVLLPGTLFDVAESWQALGPILADDGYCVFALNYGGTTLTTLTANRLWSAGPIEDSALQLRAFVAKVLATTGAAQVDLVGHSQGGMMPRWYLRFDGGAAHVHELVGLAPSNHGTTLDGLFALVDADTSLGLPAPLTLVGCPACTEQEAGSGFLGRLNQGGDTVAGVRDVVIETADDQIVTPYTSAFLSGPGAQDITLQAQCPADTTDHLGILYDGAALQDVVNALGPDLPGFAPVCGLGLAVLGG